MIFAFIQKNAYINMRATNDAIHRMMRAECKHPAWPSERAFSLIFSAYNFSLSKSFDHF